MSLYDMFLSSSSLLFLVDADFKVGIVPGMAINRNL